MPGANWVGGKGKAAKARLKNKTQTQTREHFAKTHLSARHLNPFTNATGSRPFGCSAPVFEFSHARRNLDTVPDIKHLGRRATPPSPSPDPSTRTPKRLKKATPSKPTRTLDLEEPISYDYRRRQVLKNADLSGLGRKRRERAKEKDHSDRGALHLGDPWHYLADEMGLHLGDGCTQNLHELAGIPSQIPEFAGPDYRVIFGQPFVPSDHLPANDLEPAFGEDYSDSPSTLGALGMPSENSRAFFSSSTSPYARQHEDSTTTVTPGDEQTTRLIGAREEEISMERITSDGPNGPSHSPSVDEHITDDGTDSSQQDQNYEVSRRGADPAAELNVFETPSVATVAASSYATSPAQDFSIDDLLDGTTNLSPLASNPFATLDIKTLRPRPFLDLRPPTVTLKQFVLSPISPKVAPPDASLVASTKKWLLSDDENDIPAAATHLSAPTRVACSSSSTKTEERHTEDSDAVKARHTELECDTNRLFGPSLFDNDDDEEE